MKLTLTKAPPLVLGGSPRVNLLPPELVEKAAFRKTRRSLAALVVVALVMVGGGYVLAQSRLMSAQAQLTVAQERTTELLAEQATYSDAVAATALVSASRQARTLGTSTEVLWDDLIDSIEAFLPEGASIQSGTMTGRAPWEPELLPDGPLRQPRVATAQIIVTSATVLDATDIVRRLSAVDGFADATPDLVSVVDGTFTTTITLNLGEDALSGRFASETATAEANK